MQQISLKIYYVPGTILDKENAAVNKTKSFSSFILKSNDSDTKIQ